MNCVDAIAFQIEKFFFWAFGILLGHGYRPARVFWAMALIGITCGYYYKLAAEQGVFRRAIRRCFSLQISKIAGRTNG